MSDRLETSVLLAALPVGARDFGGSDCSLAVIPCVAPSAGDRPFPFGEEP